MKGDILKVQNCHEWKSSTLGFLRSLRSPRSNNLETQNYKNSKWKLAKTRWNPKFGLSDLENDLLTSMISEEAFFQTCVIRVFSPGRKLFFLISLSIEMLGLPFIENVELLWPTRLQHHYSQVQSLSKFIIYYYSEKFNLWRTDKTNGKRLLFQFCRYILKVHMSKTVYMQTCLNS